MNRILLAATVLLAAAPTAWADDPPPVRLTLSPAAVPSRPLLHRLLPEHHQTTDEDAHPHYERMKTALQKVLRQQADSLLQDRWGEVPLDELSGPAVRRYLEKFRDVFPAIEAAARCERCDWPHSRLIRKEGVNALLPVVQELREAAGLLALKARGELIEGRWEDGVRTVRQGLAVSRHVADSPCVICDLVAIAIAQIVLKPLEDAVSRPNATSLYWALTDLPSPFVDIRKGIQGERTMLYATYPGVGALRDNLRAGPMSPEEVRKMVAPSVPEVRKLDAIPSRYGTAYKVYQRHEKAKAALIAEGRSRELIDAMPHLQVALMHAFLQYDRYHDELAKCVNLPYWEAGPRLAELRRQREREKKSADAPAIDVIEGFGLDKVFSARLRIDRRIAALRCVEAIRLHAGAKGTLPATLADVKAVPVPVDPATGKAFGYSLRDGKAMLVGIAPAGEPANAATQIRYEISLAR